MFKAQALQKNIYAGTVQRPLGPVNLSSFAFFVQWLGLFN